MQKVKKDQGTRVPTTQEPKEEARKVVRATPKDRGKVREVKPDVDYLGHSADDTGNAEIMKELYQDKYLYSPALGWLEYTGTHWKETSEAPVTLAAIDTLKRRRHSAVDASTKGKDTVAEAIIRVTHGDKLRISSCVSLFRAFVTVEQVTDFDSDPDTLNCINGVLDLRTGELSPHSSKDLFTYVSPVSYNPQANTSLWVDFLKGSFVDPEDIPYVQRCLGYSITGRMNEEKLFYVRGEKRSGKGTLQSTLLKLLPEPIGTGEEFNTFTRKRDGNEQHFDLADLRTTRLACVSESNPDHRLNPEKIKQITGRDVIKASKKHKDRFSYYPQFKLWMFSNWPINANVNDDALWGRVEVFDFPISYFGREDKTLKDRLQQETSLEGVLAWVVEGSKLWYKEGLGNAPASHKALLQSHMDRQDHLKTVLTDYCLFREGAFTTYTDLMALYKKFCEDNSVRPMRPQDFSDALVKRFSLTPYRQPGGGARGYKGIYIKKASDYRREEQEAKALEDTTPKANGHSSNGHTTEGLLQDLEELDVAFSGIEGL